MIFGIHANDLEVARGLIESAVGIRMIPHESDYLFGEYYRFGNIGGEQFVLQRNYDDVSREWAEPSFSGYQFVLYVNKTLRPRELAAMIGAAGQLLSLKET